LRQRSLDPAAVPRKQKWKVLTICSHVLSHVTWRSFYFNSTIALSGILKTQPYPTLRDPNEVSHILSRINSWIMHPFGYTSWCLKNNNKSVWNSFLQNWLRLVLRGRFSDFCHKHNSKKQGILPLQNHLGEQSCSILSLN